MKWKNRLTNYNFWISIVSAVLLVLQAFEFELNIAYINEIATAVLGLLVVIGIISDPTKTYSNGTTESANIETKETELVQEEKGIEEIKLPNEIETEGSDDNNEDDFKVLMNKISADINDNLARINEIQNAIINEINLKPEDFKPETQDNEIENKEKSEVEISTCLNIVNN